MTATTAETTTQPPQSLAEWVAEQLPKCPPLSPSQRSKISLLLRPRPQQGDAR